MLVSIIVYNIWYKIQEILFLYDHIATLKTDLYTLSMLMISLVSLQNTLDDHIYTYKILQTTTYSSIYLLKGLRQDYVLKEPHNSWEIENIYQEYLRSHRMYNHSYIINKVKSYGVLKNDTWTPYHIQEHVSWSPQHPKSYTTKDMQAVASHLWAIHNLQLEDQSLQDSLESGIDIFWKSKDGILYYRDIYNLHHHPLCKELLELYDHYRTLLLPWLQWRPRRYLHGDFSTQNIIFHPDGIRLIDFWRSEYGDAVIDVGVFRARMMLFDLTHHLDTSYTRSKSFLKQYISSTKDQDITRYLILPLLYIAYISIGNYFSGSMTDKLRETIYWVVQDVHQHPEKFFS